MRIAPTTLVLMIGVLSLGLIDVPKDKQSGDRSLAPKIMLLLPTARRQTQELYNGVEIVIRSRVKSIDVARVESEIGSATSKGHYFGFKAQWRRDKGSGTIVADTRAYATRCLPEGTTLTGIKLLGISRLAYSVNGAGKEEGRFAVLEASASTRKALSSDCPRPLPFIPTKGLPIPAPPPPPPPPPQ
jgi:hypothetical protein